MALSSEVLHYCSSIELFELKTIEIPVICNYSKSFSLHIFFVVNGSYTNLLLLFIVVVVCAYARVFVYVGGDRDGGSGAFWSND